MKKRTAVLLLAVLSVVFPIAVGLPLVFLMAWVGDDFGAGAAAVSVSVFALLHAVGSTFSARRYKRKYGLSAPKFALLNILPTFALAALTYLIVIFSDMGWDGLVPAVIAVSFGGYMLGYAAVLSIVMGIAHIIDRKKADSTLRKGTAAVLLAVFGNLLVIAAGAAQITLIALMPAPVVVLVLHIIAAKFSCRRFRRKYGMSAGRYILYGALPAALLNIVAFAAAAILTEAGFTLPLPTIDMLPPELPLSIFAAGYSTVYIIILAVVLKTDKIYKGNV